MVYKCNRILTNVYQIKIHRLHFSSSDSRYEYLLAKEIDSQNLKFNGVQAFCIKRDIKISLRDLRECVLSVFQLRWENCVLRFCIPANSRDTLMWLRSSILMERVDINFILLTHVKLSNMFRSWRTVYLIAARNKLNQKKNFTLVTSSLVTESRLK